MKLDLSLSPDQSGKAIIFLRWFFLAAMVIVLSICLYVFARIYVWPQQPRLPVDIELIDSGIVGPVCPGDIAHITTRLTILHSTTLDIVYSVMDEASISNIPDTQIEYLPRPHPHAGTFDQSANWTVPNIAPGKYTRVTSIQGHNLLYQPEFLIVPFTIRSKEECNE